jgi:alcohol dehydrogenase
MVQPSNLEARGDMMLGAHLAGVAIEQSMLGAAHACANPLTARFDLAHGLALAALLPHVVRWNGGIAADGYAALLDDTTQGVRAAANLAARVDDLIAAGNLQGRLRDRGVGEDSLSDLAALAAQQWTGTFNPRPFDAAGALEIYQTAY